MVHPRQLIPPLTLLTRSGQRVKAWDYKHKRNLVILFLDGDCRLCKTLVHGIVSSAEKFWEQEAVVLLVFPAQSSLGLDQNLPDGVVAGWDVNGRGKKLFFGQGGPDGPESARGIFVTDRYGEISEQWIVTAHEFPSIPKILSSLELVEIACEECGVPDWPVEE